MSQTSPTEEGGERGRPGPSPHGDSHQPALRQMGVSGGVTEGIFHWTVMSEGTSEPG